MLTEVGLGGSKVCLLYLKEALLWSPETLNKHTARCATVAGTMAGHKIIASLASVRTCLRCVPSLRHTKGTMARWLTGSVSGFYWQYLLKPRLFGEGSLLFFTDWYTVGFDENFWSFKLFFSLFQCSSQTPVFILGLLHACEVQSRAGIESEL